MEFLDFVEESANIEVNYKVTPFIYETFQRISKDMNLLHVDDDFAKSMGFPQRVMYGNILNCFVSHFVGMALPSFLPSYDVMIQTQDIQYRKPIYLNDDILLKSEIESYSDSVEIVQYKLKFYRIGVQNNVLVATGHVQIGLLKQVK